jgi:hypothetical protein
VFLRVMGEKQGTLPLKFAAIWKTGVCYCDFRRIRAGAGGNSLKFHIPKILLLQNHPPGTAKLRYLRARALIGVFGIAPCSEKA